jgi:hypothetical protein
VFKIHFRHFDLLHLPPVPRFDVMRAMGVESSAARPILPSGRNQSGSFLFRMQSAMFSDLIQSHQSYLEIEVVD